MKAGQLANYDDIFKEGTKEKNKGIFWQIEIKGWSLSPDMEGRSKGMSMTRNS